MVITIKYKGHLTTWWLSQLEYYSLLYNIIFVVSILHEKIPANIVNDWVLGQFDTPGVFVCFLALLEVVIVCNSLSTLFPMHKRCGI